LLIVLVTGTTLLLGCSEERNPLLDEGETSKKEPTSQQVESKGSENGGPIKVKEPEEEEKAVEDPKRTKESKSAEIKRSPSTDERIRTPGVWNLEVHLVDDKINRLNQLRDPSLMSSYPDLFGIDLDFEPLLSMEGKGPGKVRITGTNIDPIEFNLGNEKERYEIFPYYNMGFLTTDIEDAKEKLEILYVNESKEELIDKLQTTWSNERELNISDKNLNDIISLVDADRPEGELKFKDLKNWLIAATGGLDKYNIKFEEIKGDEPFTQIRTSREMREDKRATAYDLSIWLANKAIEHGFDCEIIILPKHALISVSNVPREKNALKSPEQSYIETRVLLDKETISQGAFEKERNILKERVDESLKVGQETINEQFKLGADNMIALKIEEWDKLYRDTK
jgi:hypothetical protein